jgi:hypothetical protein
MALPLRTTAAGVPAAGIAEGERAGEEVGREGKAPQQFKLALSKTSGLRAARFVCLIVVIMLQENSKSKRFL